MTGRENGSDPSGSADEPLYYEQYEYGRRGGVGPVWRGLQKLAILFNFLIGPAILIGSGYAAFRGIELYLQGNFIGIVALWLSVLTGLIGLVVTAWVSLYSLFVLRLGRETFTVDADGVTIRSAGFLDRRIEASEIRSVRETESILPGGAERISLGVSINFLPMALGRRFYGFRAFAPADTNDAFVWWGREAEPGVLIETEGDEVRIDTDRPGAFVSAVESIVATPE